MRDLNEILKEYNEVIKDTRLTEIAPRVHTYANQPLRVSLGVEADTLLSADKKLAILLHTKLCSHNHTDECCWYYEIDGILRDWSRREHKDYLEKVQKMLLVTSDTGVVSDIINCL